MPEDIQVGRFKGHSKKSGKDYEYYRLRVRDEEGKYWVSDYVFPNWTPADSDGNAVSMRPALSPL
jgi:RPA family protein